MVAYFLAVYSIPPALGRNAFCVHHLQPDETQLADGDKARCCGQLFVFCVAFFGSQTSNVVAVMRSTPFVSFSEVM